MNPKPLLLAYPFEEIRERLRSASRLLLFSDFDGTLVPLRDRPEECYLAPGTGRVLTALAEAERVAVGLVSGRELNDLRRRIGIAGIAYAGNHGLEIEGPGFSFREPAAGRIAKEIRVLVRSVERELSGISGARVEDKGLTASVHYHQANPAEVPELLERVRRLCADAVAAGTVRLREGKMTLEIRPAVEWNKASAVRWLAERFTPSNDAAVLFYLGDDATDEDVFSSFSGGITVRVGETGATSANYSLPDPAGVALFLEWLLRIV